VTDKVRTDEIFRIIEVEIIDQSLTPIQIRELQIELETLIRGFPEGANKKKVMAKIRDKQRFCYYINNTGILDFTGYGKNFW
jgi:hypothetical protein